MVDAASSAASDVIDALTFSPGVVGVVVCTAEGTPIRDSFHDLDRGVATRYAALAADLLRYAARTSELLPLTQKIAAGATGAGKRHSKADGERPGDEPKGDAASPQGAGSSDAQGNDEEVDIIRVRTRTNEVIAKWDGEFIVVIVQEMSD